MMPEWLPFQQTEVGCRVEGTKWHEVRSGSVRAGMQITRSLRRPWLREARVARFGRGLGEDDVRRVVSALAEFAHERPILRLRVEAFSERPAERDVVASACRANGFRPAELWRSYASTVLIDLTPSEDDLLAGFHKTARQNIRAPGKKGLVVRGITDVGLAGKLQALLESSFRRTGVVAPRPSWPALLAHAAERSASAHVAGIFREDDAKLEEPLGFAAAFLHGEVAEYAYAGSMRDPGLKVSLLYAVAWELMLWAKRRGAVLWDFGGVSDSEPGEGDDRRAGISGFKRFFRPEAVAVGEEWVLEPRRGLLSSALAALRPWRV